MYPYAKARDLDQKTVFWLQSTSSSLQAHSSLELVLWGIPKELYRWSVVTVTSYVGIHHTRVFSGKKLIELKVRSRKNAELMEWTIKTLPGAIRLYSLPQHWCMQSLWRKSFLVSNYSGRNNQSIHFWGFPSLVLVGCAKCEYCWGTCTSYNPCYAPSGSSKQSSDPLLGTEYYDLSANDVLILDFPCNGFQLYTNKAKKHNWEINQIKKCTV